MKSGMNRSKNVDKFDEGINVLISCTSKRFVYFFLDGLLALRDKKRRKTLKTLACFQSTLRSYCTQDKHNTFSKKKTCAKRKNVKIGII